MEAAEGRTWRAAGGRAWGQGAGKLCGMLESLLSAPPSSFLRDTQGPRELCRSYSPKLGIHFTISVNTEDSKSS